MVFLQFFRNYWIIIVLTGVFFAGYHLRSIQYAGQEERNLIKESQKQQRTDSAYADMDAQINKLYDNLNEKVTYADTYSCIIPADGMRLLSQATGGTR